MLTDKERINCFAFCIFRTKISYGQADMSFVKAAWQVKKSLRIRVIRSKISCWQVDMTFGKAAWQLKIVCGFLTSDLKLAVDR